ISKLEDPDRDGQDWTGARIVLQRFKRQFGGQGFEQHVFPTIMMQRAHEVLADVEPRHDVEAFLAKYLRRFRHRELERDVENDASAVIIHDALLTLCSTATLVPPVTRTRGRTASPRADFPAVRRGRAGSGACERL